MKKPSAFSFPSLFLTLLLAASVGGISACTSSDEPPSALEEELGDLDTGGEGLSDDLGELAEGEELTEEVEGLEGLEDSGGEDLLAEEGLGEELESEFSEEGEVGGEAELAELDDSFDDADFSDDGEFASNEDDFADFDESEFDEFGEEKSEFAQNEQTLQEELNQAQGGGEIPVAENAQPAFPEEVVGQNQMDPAALPMPVDDSTVQSETRDIVALEPIGGAEPPLPQDDLGEPDPLAGDEENPEPQSWVPVVKVKTDPFFKNGRLMNAVYIARPKDTYESITQKLFSADKIEDLKADNPHLAKGVDAGDKVYYNSPNRPEDKSVIKVYYDDIGLKPQYYTTKGGDNMRRLGLKLLGFPDGWKEVWAINQNVDSKTILPDNLEIKYWTGEEGKVEMPVALNESTDSANTNPQTAAAGTVQDPFGEDFPDEPALPAEPPLPEASLAMADQLPQPEILPEVEPFPEQVMQPSAPVAVPASQDSLLSVGALALLLIAGVALVAIQIKKRKEATMVSPRSLEYTQV